VSNDPVSGGEYAVVTDRLKSTKLPSTRFWHFSSTCTVIMLL